MEFKRILKCITGISVPIFGIQWKPVTDEVDIAQNIIVFLEDKRVLFNPIDMKAEIYCVQSVNEIRTEITRILQQTPSTYKIVKQLKELRKISQRFINEIGSPNFSSFETPIKKSILENELFKLRQGFGRTISNLSLAYGINVDDDLAAIMPFNNIQNI